MAGLKRFSGETKINARSIDERDMRIADLLERGFEVIRYYEKEKDSIQWSDSGFKEGSRFRHQGSSYTKTYGCVMRKVVEKS